MRNIIFLTVIALAFTLTSLSCKTKVNDDGNFSVLSCKTKDSDDGKFSVYGKWVYVVSPESYYEWKMVPPSMKIEHDNTLTLWLYESKYTGVIEQVDEYNYNFNALTLQAEGQEYEVAEVDKVVKITYNHETKQLIYGRSFGDIPFRKITDHEFTYTVWYEDTIHKRTYVIPVTVFYSPLKESGISVDSLSFIYHQKKQSVKLQGTHEPLYIRSFDPEDFFYLKFNDYNFDEYLDISLLREGLQYDTYDIYMYNPIKKTYSYHSELSKIKELWLDLKDKSVISSITSGMAGNEYITEEYKWVKDQLTLVKSAKQNYDSGKYVRVIGTMQNDGSWREKTEIFTEKELSN